MSCLDGLQCLFRQEQDGRGGGSEQRQEVLRAATGASVYEPSLSDLPDSEASGVKEGAAVDNVCVEDYEIMVGLPVEDVALDGVACMICGLNIYGVVCCGPLTAQVHYACAVSQQQELADSRIKRYLKRCRRASHLERWENQRAKKLKRAREPRSGVYLTPEITPECKATVDTPGCLHAAWQSMATLVNAVSFRTLREAGVAGLAYVQDAANAWLHNDAEVLAANAAESLLDPGLHRRGHGSSGSKLEGLWQTCIGMLQNCFRSVLTLVARPAHTTFLVRRRRKLLQQGSRGAHLARMAAVRRGVSLSNWSKVRCHRVAHHWANSSFINRSLANICQSMLSVVAHMASAWCHLWRPALSGARSDTANANIPLQLQSRTLARAYSKELCSQRFRKRLLHTGLFMLLVQIFHCALPMWISMTIAYALVKIIAIRSRIAHGAGCRTATSTAIAVGVFSMGHVAVLGGILFALLLPRCLLWWPAPKRPAAVDELGASQSQSRHNKARQNMQEVINFLRGSGGRAPSKHNSDNYERNLYHKLQRLKKSDDWPVLEVEYNRACAAQIKPAQR